MKFDPKVIGFIVALPSIYISSLIVKALLSTGGDVIQATAQDSVHETEGMPGNATLTVLGWIPWGDVLPLLPTVFTVVGVVLWVKSRTGR